MLRFQAAILFFVVSWAICDAEDWPEFRGPTGQGHSTEIGLPVQWSLTSNIAWKSQIPGNGWSSPICFDGRIVLTTALQGPSGEQEDQSLRALCIDAKTGKVLWNVEVFNRNIVPTVNLLHRKNGHASPTPVTDGETVYVHFGPEGTAALTRDGEIVWKNQKLEYVPRHGNGGSPVLVDDLLVVACDGLDVDYIVALDRVTGVIRWKTDRTVDLAKKFSFSTPLVIEAAGRRQIVCPGTGHIGAYEPETGKEIWRVDYGDGYSVIPRPVFGHGLVYVCTGWNTPWLLAIRPTGRGNVTLTHVEWQIKSNVPNTPSLLLIQDKLYLISDRGIASCLEARTGRQIWRQRIGGDFSASPIFADGKIYMQS